MSYIGNIPAENYASFLTETFSVSATANYTLSHAVSNENDIRLVINNVIQQPGSGKAYTASGTTLTLTSATSSGDIMYAVYLGRALQTVTPPNASVGTAQIIDSSVTSAKLASGVGGASLSGSTNNTVATVTGANALIGEANLTFDGSNLTVASTSAGSTTNPFFNIDRNSSSPANNDVLGRTNFRGRTNTGANADYAFLTAQALDVTNGSEGGSLNIGGLVGGAERSFVKGTPTEVVINDQSEDMDFRVESNGSTHALFVQASDGAVLIGTSTDGSAGAGDLVVNSGVYLGGSAAANKLDDYEEGTFTPVWISNVTIGVSSGNYGLYTKIGNLVTLQFGAVLSTSGGTPNYYSINNAPFQSNLPGGYAVGVANEYGQTGDMHYAKMGDNSTTIMLKKYTGTAIINPYIMATITYQTD